MVKTLGDARSAAELATLGDALTQRVDSEQERARRRITSQMAFLRRERDTAQGMVRYFDRLSSLLSKVYYRGLKVYGRDLGIW